MSSKKPEPHEQEEIDIQDFSDEIDMISNRSTNIIDQLPSYNSDDTQSFLNNLETELEQQKTLNMLLEDKNLASELNKIKNFTEKNSNKIEQQLNDLKRISSDLQEIITKNQSLKDKSDEIKEIAQSKEYNDIAKKLRDIKAEKENIKNFLKNSGIISPPLIVLK